MGRPSVLINNEHLPNYRYLGALVKREAMTAEKASSISKALDIFSFVFLSLSALQVLGRRLPA